MAPLLKARERLEVSLIKGAEPNGVSVPCRPNARRKSRAIGGVVRKTHERGIHVAGAEDGATKCDGSLVSQNRDADIKSGNSIVVPVKVGRMLVLPIGRQLIATTRPFRPPAVNLFR